MIKAKLSDGEVVVGELLWDVSPTPPGCQDRSLPVCDSRCVDATAVAVVQGCGFWRRTCACCRTSCKWGTSTMTQEWMLRQLQRRGSRKSENVCCGRDVRRAACLLLLVPVTMYAAAERA